MSADMKFVFDEGASPTSFRPQMILQVGATRIPIGLVTAISGHPGRKGNGHRLFRATVVTPIPLFGDDLELDMMTPAEGELEAAREEGRKEERERWKRAVHEVVGKLERSR